MLESYKKELESIRAAIIKLTADPTTSQSVSSANGGSFSASYVDLSRLYAREKELVTLIATLYREQSGEDGIGLGLGLGVTYPIYCGG